MSIRIPILPSRRALSIAHWAFTFGYFQLTGFVWILTEFTAMNPGKCLWKFSELITHLPAFYTPTQIQLISILGNRELLCSFKLDSFVRKTHLKFQIVSASDFNGVKTRLQAQVSRLEVQLKDALLISFSNEEYLLSVHPLVFIHCCEFHQWTALKCREREGDRDEKLCLIFSIIDTARKKCAFNI